MCFYYEHGVFGFGVLAGYTRDMTLVRSVSYGRGWKWIQRTLALRTRKGEPGSWNPLVGNGNEQTDRKRMETRLTCRGYLYTVLNSNENKFTTKGYYFSRRDRGLKFQGDDSSEPEQRLHNPTAMFPITSTLVM
jgi:hypothetical protein